LEQSHRAALDDHVHRTARLGLSVMINARWYNSPTTRSRSTPCGTDPAGNFLGLARFSPALTQKSHPYAGGYSTTLR
ncbi:hypothetical protein, partial [Methylobacterium oxalidis]|uniref:hypothetical protein n=1 Tax=Methylobacterium oxalidis TaxID=944322 RepID=UPI003314F78C